jgi:hypothetical protein
MAFGQSEHSRIGEYQFDLAAEVFVSGVIFGVLVVELGTLWPAVLEHALTNIDPVLRESAPGLSLTGMIVVLIVTVGTIAVSVALLAVRPAVRLVAGDRARAWLSPATRPAPEPVVA